MKSSGLVIRRGSSVVLETCKDLSTYYQSLLRNYISKFNKPLWYPHITIIRDSECTILSGYPLFQSFTNYIEFEYEPTIVDDGVYFWIPVKTNKHFEKIRCDHGLSTYCYDLQKGYHITIANLKGIKHENL